MNECCPICGGHHQARHHHQAPAAQNDCGCGCGCETHGHEEKSDPGEDDPPSPGPDSCGCSGQSHHHPPSDHPTEHPEGCQCAPAPADDDFSDLELTGPGRAVYRIENMDCPMEEALIRGKLEKMNGVTGLEFNLMKRILTIRHHLDSTEGLEKALNSIDMKPVALTAQSAAERPVAAGGQWGRLGAAGLMALGAEITHLAAGDHWLTFLLALAAIVTGGLTTYKKGWVALKNFNLNMNGLMSFAVTGALIIGQWPEAAMVMVLFNVAEAIEAKSLARARQAIGGLMSLAPDVATVRESGGLWREVPAQSVAVGRIVRVRPGEKVALDGEIIAGASAVNQAPITGESLPVEKSVGDPVFAGTINESGSFEYRVTAAFKNSTLSRIIKAVEEAQSSRAPIQRFVDRFAQIYTPLVFIGALMVGLIPPMVMDGDWLGWAYKGLVLLVIACPCALVISTPVTIVSALAAATRHGLLIKGGAFLEEGRKLTALAFDKTGTITTGRPRQTDMRIIKGEAHKVRALAASLAARSDHPVSKAVSEAAAKNDINLRFEVENFTAIPGQGVKGLMEGGQWMLGNRRMINEAGGLSKDVESFIESLEKESKSVVGLVGPDGVAAVFAVADTVRPTSRQAVAELKKLGLRTVMLTGDNQAAAQAVAAETGLDEAYGGLLPEGKLAQVTRLSERGKVGMVGDGINDAPALARADIGFAMGAAGTDTAIETADVALMDDDPGKLALFIKLSKAAHRVLWQNITLALGIKMAFFILTFMGETTMWMAVFADIGVSLMVVFNGLRMLRFGS